MSEQASAALRALTAARSVRTFDGQPVPLATVREIVDTARWTGSARNRQPWRLVAVTDRATLAALARLGAYAQHVATAPVALVLLSADDGRRDTEFDVGRIAQSLTLAAQVRGLGCCLATLYPDDNVAVAAALVDAPAGWVPRHVLSLGRPGHAPVGRSAIPGGRRPVDDLLTIHRPAGPSA